MTKKKLLGKCKWQRKGKKFKEKGEKLSGEKEKEKEKEETVGPRIRRNFRRIKNDDSIFEVGLNFLYSFKCDLNLASQGEFFSSRKSKVGRFKIAHILDIPALFSQDKREGI